MLRIFVNLGQEILELGPHMYRTIMVTHTHTLPVCIDGIGPRCDSTCLSVTCVCQVIIMGATNRPQDLDSAILRRMPTRFHINQPVSTHVYTQLKPSKTNRREVWQGWQEVVHEFWLCVTDASWCVQIVRQREQILRLILENENVSLPQALDNWSVGPPTRLYVL